MLKTKICGFYKLEAVNAKTGKSRMLADWFPNLITDIGMDYLGTPHTNSTNFAETLRCCYVGSGSAAPTVSDISMQSIIATKDATYILDVLNRSIGIHSTSPYYRYYRGTYRFNEGVAAGNISEVGMGWGTSHAGSVFSRALVLDSYGNPTTITVLSDEYLDVTYELRSYPNEGDVTGSVTFTGNIGGTYNWTIRPINITYLPAWYADVGFPVKISTIYSSSNSATVVDTPLAPITTGYTSTGLVSVGTTAYTNGTLYKDMTLSVALDNGNFATGIKRFIIYIFGCGYQVELDPAIAKTSSDVVTITLRVSWARV